MQALVYLRCTELTLVEWLLRPIEPGGTAASRRASVEGSKPGDQSLPLAEGPGSETLHQLVLSDEADALERLRKSKTSRYSGGQPNPQCVWIETLKS